MGLGRIVSFAVVALGGCSLLVGVDDLAGGGVDACEDCEVPDAPDAAPAEAGQVAADAAPDVADDDARAGCGVAGRGPSMIMANGFCVDATEVTQAQYAQFVAATAGDTTGQPPECAWNDAFKPFSHCPYDPEDLGTHPVRGVDWCDAYAFCRWAGKRLCGALGDGGVLGPDDSTDPKRSEWAAACTRYDDGLHAYPYGDEYRATSCNVGDFDAGTTVPVTSPPECTGGLPGLHGMSGNVWEWVNECEGDAGPEDECRTLGGSYNSSSNQASCKGRYTPPRDGNLECQLGFRCCASP